MVDRPVILPVKVPAFSKFRVSPAWLIVTPTPEIMLFNPITPLSAISISPVGIPAPI